MHHADYNQCCGKIMTEFVGLGSKLHSHKILKEQDEKRKPKFGCNPYINLFHRYVL